MSKYNPQEIEPKWQKYWEEHPEFFAADDKSEKEKQYILDMFPYPSGDGLHVGHVEGYTAADIISRYLRMNGKNVLHPTGWDSFGLPAENYAIKTKVHPSITTQKAIATFKSQMMKLGLSYDWSREVDSSNPDYYKWTQWFFLLLYKNGLAYRKKASVNWCLKCQTVLANEQVIAGKCERCETEVIQKDLEQWFFKITDFIEDSFLEARLLSTEMAQRSRASRTSGLLKGLDKVDWPESTKAAQRNWIGKSEGSEVDFIVEGKENKISVYTTRIDTIFSGTYLILAPENELVEKITTEEQKKEVEKYVAETVNKTELQRIGTEGEKTGVFTGSYAINPATEEKIPIWISDFVIGRYGTGAVFADAHDERDFKMAKKYGIPLKASIKPEDDKLWKKVKNLETCYTEEGILVNSGQFDGLTSNEARIKITEWLSQKSLARFKSNYKLRDWLVSRQRYWGTPIPIIYCDECAKQREQVLMLHGWEDSSKTGFFPALKENLEEKGYRVFAFDQPNTDTPDYDKWQKFIEDKIKDNKLKNFHLIGHSMGGHLAAKLSEKYKLKSLTLIAPVGFKPPEEYFKKFTDKLSKDEMQIFKQYQNRSLDMDKVKKNVEKINIIFGAQDEWIEENIRNYYAEKFGSTAKIEILPEYAHMSESEGVKRVKFLENLFTQSNPGIVPVPEKDLPVELPDDVDFNPTGESPLTRSKKFHNVKCPVCRAKARREPDTMDTFVCSSWYYFRYTDPKNNKEFAGKEKIKKWLPVDLYVGGAEHTVLHLLYSRFFTKVLHRLGYIDFDEPFLKLRHQGIILGEDNFKMSKSRGNVINPDDVINEFGADALRMFEMFMGPLEDAKPWNTKGIIGIYRFLDKAYRFLQGDMFGGGILDAPNNDEEAKRIINKAIKKVTIDIENLRFNTAISQLMITINEIKLLVLKNTISKDVTLDFREKFVLLLSTFAPHISEELWSRLGHKESIFKEKWPKYDPKLTKDKEIELVVQVNGKVRDRIKASADISEEEAKKFAMQSEKVKKYTNGKEIKKAIFVKGKLINIVV